MAEAAASGHAVWHALLALAAIVVPLLIAYRLLGASQAGKTRRRAPRSRD